MKAQMTSFALAIAVVAIGCGGDRRVERAAEEAKEAARAGAESVEQGTEAVAEGLEQARDTGAAAAGALSDAARDVAAEAASDAAAAVEQAGSLVAEGAEAVARVRREAASATHGAVTGVADFSYEVVAGDTLGTIARRHLGDASLYRLIAEANPGTITNPDLIYPGQVLQLPRPE